MGLPCFFIYHLIATQQSNNPNNHIYWNLLISINSNITHKSRALRALVSSTIEQIKYLDMNENIKKLGNLIFLIPNERSPTTEYIEYYEDHHYQSNDNMDDQSITLEDESFTAAQNGPPMLQYIKAFTKFSEIYNTEHDLNRWNSFASRMSALESSLIQIFSLPMLGMTAFALQNELLLSRGVSVETSRWVSTGLTAFLGTPLLLLISTKWLPRVDKEFNFILRGYPPEVEGNYRGQRLAPWLARSASFLYVTVPIIPYLIDNILRKNIGITNPYWQSALVAPFAFSYIYIFGNLIFDPPFTQLANWIATGGRINLSEIFSWIAEGGYVDLSTRCYSCKPFQLTPCCNVESSDDENVIIDDIKANDIHSKPSNTLEEENSEAFYSKHVPKFSFLNLLSYFGSFRLCCCFGNDGETEEKLNILNRMMGIQEIVQDLNPKYSETLYKELKEINIKLPDDYEAED